MPDSPNKAAALALVNRGIRVFPCNADKTPRVSAWQDAATNNVFDVAVKWDAAPTALPAIPVGSHGLVVIDADRKPGRADGVAAFQALCASHGIDLATAFIVETPSGGLHYYFASPKPYGNSSGSLPDGIDVRGLGGYVIAPGATLPDGRSYRILSGSWDAIPPLPDALAGFLREKRAAEPLSLHTRSDAPLPGHRERRYASAALEEEVANLRAMQYGSCRNEALNKAAHSLGTMDGWIDLNEVAEALYEASVDDGYVSKDGASTARQTIASGIEAGRKKPRKMLTDWTGEELAEDEPWIRTMIEAAKRKLTIESPIAAKNWPSPMNADAYTGIAGEFVGLVAPHSEGDPNALMVSFLTIVGSLIGRGAYKSLNADRHYTNLFTVLVGRTSSGRKGTVTSEAKRVARLIDPTIELRMKSGMSTGEGLIDHVRDIRYDDAPAGSGKDATPKVLDTGVADKRLLVVESEMGQAFQCAGRDGNILSAILRLAWEGSPLRTMARNNKNVCLEPHISILGNITLEELQRLLTSTDKANGFGNRILWVCTQRSQQLPFGGNIDVAKLQELAIKAAHFIHTASSYGEIGWMPDAMSLWARNYGRLTKQADGLVASMCGRAAPQTLRIAMIYAILEGHNYIHAHHLSAALEVWRYCEESVHYCFGTSSGDSTADRILTLLVNSPNGAGRTAISSLFQNNKKKEELDRALDKLRASGKARSELRQSNGTGRAAEVWLAC